MRWLFVTVVYFALCSAVCAAKDIYIAQSASGADSGADCVDAHSAAWFSSAANWGSGTSQIGPGTVVHLCGTFTGVAGSTMLTVQGSGVSGSPITIHFEPNALLTAPFWSPTNGAINIAGKSFITLDGGTNGTINCTSNGTGLANSVDTTGVLVTMSTNIEVKNLSILNMYVRTPGSTDFCNCGNGIQVVDGGAYDIHDNIIRNAHFGIIGQYDGAVTNWKFRNNKISRVAAGAKMGDGSGGSFLTNSLFDNNEVSDMFVWDYPVGFDQFHADGFHLFATNTGSHTDSVTISNNFFHGDPGGHATAWIFCTAVGGGGGNTNLKIYNNVVTSVNQVPNDGQVSVGQSPGVQLYNNTLVGTGSGIGFELNDSTSMKIENNIVSKLTPGIFVVSATSSITTSNFNEFNFTGAAGQAMVWQGGFLTWSGWLALGFDASSLGPSSDPLLDLNFNLTASSPGIGKGANLASLGITALDSDKAGTPRPSTGPWDLGSYVFNASRPNPPTGLVLIQIR